MVTDRQTVYNLRMLVNLINSETAANLNNKKRLIQTQTAPENNCLSTCTKCLTYYTPSGQAFYKCSDQDSSLLIVLILCVIVGVLIFLIIVVIIVIKRKRREYIINKPKVIENLNNNEYNIISGNNRINNDNLISDNKKKDNKDEEKKEKEKILFTDQDHKENQNKYKIKILSSSAIKPINSQINTNCNTINLNSARDSEQDKSKKKDLKMTMKEMLHKNKKLYENAKKLIPNAINQEKYKNDRGSIDSNSSNKILTNAMKHGKIGSADLLIPNNEIFKINKNADEQRDKNFDIKIIKGIKFDSGGSNNPIQSSPEFIEGEKILITNRNSDYSAIRVNNTRDNLLTETDVNKEENKNKEENRKEKKDGLDTNIKNLKILNTMLNKANEKKLKQKISSSNIQANKNP